MKILTINETKTISGGVQVTHKDHTITFKMDSGETDSSYWSLMTPTAHWPLELNQKYFAILDEKFYDKMLNDDSFTLKKINNGYEITYKLD